MCVLLVLCTRKTYCIQETRGLVLVSPKPENVIVYCRCYTCAYIHKRHDMTTMKLAVSNITFLSLSAARRHQQCWFGGLFYHKTRPSGAGVTICIHGKRGIFHLPMLLLFGCNTTLLRSLSCVAAGVCGYLPDWISSPTVTISWEWLRKKIQNKLCSVSCIKRHTFVVPFYEITKNFEAIHSWGYLVHRLVISSAVCRPMCLFLAIFLQLSREAL